MKGLTKRIVVAASGVVALGTSSAAVAEVYSYSYYECSYGVCQLITCYVHVDDGPRGTTTEICLPDGLGGLGF